MAEQSDKPKAAKYRPARVVTQGGGCGSCGWAFIVAYVGAVVYFVHQTSGFGAFCWALVKAAVWPGIVLYHVLGILKV